MRWPLTPFFALYLNLLVIVALGLNGSCSRSPAAPATPPSSSDKVHTQGIYGADNRHDLYREPSPALRLLADSTVLIVKNEDLSFDGAKRVRLKLRTLADAQYACLDEPFRDQVTSGFCSGFLVSPELIITAGHCIPDEKSCAETSMVFGFGLSSESASLETLEQAEVYQCSRIVHTQVSADGPDFAVIALDRKAAGHRPLKLSSRGGEIAPREEVFTIGHPMGLPTKITDQAHVRSVVAGSHFVTNLDSYEGNSGSPVFSASSLEVEGILVRGGTDMVLRPDELCYASVRCGDDDCQGEDATTISAVRPFLH